MVRDAQVCLVEAVSCKGVTKQSKNSPCRKGLKEVGNRFICEVLGLTDSGGLQVLWILSVSFGGKGVEMKTSK